MQINIVSNLPCSSGEASVKTTEKDEAGSASSFFAQIGQLWNEDNENGESQAAEKSEAPNSARIGIDPVGVLLGATMLSLNPIKAEPIPDSGLSGFSLQVLADNSGAGEDAKATSPEAMADNNLHNSVKTSADELRSVSVGKEALEISISPNADGESLEISISANAEGEPLEVSVPPNAPETAQLLKTWTYSPPDEMIQPPATASKTLTAADDAQPALSEMQASAAGIPGAHAVEESMMPDSASAAPESFTDLQTGFSESLKKSDTVPPAPQDQRDAAHPAFQKLGPGLETMSEQSGSTSDSPISRTSNQQNEIDLPSRADSPEETPSVSTQQSDQALRDESRSIPEARYIRSVLQKIAQSDTGMEAKSFSPAPAAHAESRHNTVSMPDLRTTTYDTGSREPLPPPPDLKTETNLPNQANPKGLENSVQASPEGADAGGSNPNLDHAHSEPDARQIVKGKSEEGQIGVSQKFQLPLSDRPQETHSTFASNPAKIAEPNNFSEAFPPSAPATQSRELVFQLADHIRVQLREGKGEIRIQLKPDLLGRIEIKAETTGSGVTARIATESESVKSYLENNLQLLQQTLNDQGLRVDRIHIIVQDALDSRSSSGFGAQLGHSGSGRNSHNPDVSSNVSESGIRAPMDEITLDPQSWLALNPGNRFYTVA
ncbi:MAG: flagellar hook-length control protein FliK [Acidobacteria bacterium]|nr:flagellar hook-length control protein FliK [Acidobacteriota bacterium]